MLVPAGKKPEPVLAWQRAVGRGRRRHGYAGCLAAQVLATLEHVNLEIPLDQLVCRAQASNSAADDDHFFAHGRDPRCVTPKRGGDEIFPGKSWRAQFLGLCHSSVWTLHLVRKNLR